MDLPLTEVKKRLGAGIPAEKAEELFNVALERSGLPLKKLYTPEEVLELSAAMTDSLLTEINQFDFSQIELD